MSLTEKKKRNFFFSQFPYFLVLPITNCHNPLLSFQVNTTRCSVHPKRNAAVPATVKLKGSKNWSKCHAFQWQFVSSIRDECQFISGVDRLWALQMFHLPQQGPSPFSHKFLSLGWNTLFPLYTDASWSVLWLTAIGELHASLAHQALCGRADNENENASSLFDASSLAHKTAFLFFVQNKNEHWLYCQCGLNLVWRRKWKKQLTLCSLEVKWRSSLCVVRSERRHCWQFSRWIYIGLYRFHVTKKITCLIKSAGNHRINSNNKCVGICCQWKTRTLSVDSLSTKRYLQRKLKPNVT